MEQLLQLFTLVPLLGFIVTLFFRQKNENLIATIAISTVGIQLVGLILFVINMKSPDCRYEQTRLSDI